MNVGTVAYVAASVFDGRAEHRDSALLINAGTVSGICAAGDLPRDMRVVELGGGILAPGFVDLQVNGGDGIMLGDDPTPAGLARIAGAHVRLGSTTILPTLISDTAENTARVIDAVKTAVASGVAVIGGLHLEGPHLAPGRHGAHDPDMIRPMEDADLDLLCQAARDLPVLVVTVAPESVTTDQVARLVQAGAVVSLGHTNAGFADCASAEQAGASCVTHLFNAMSGMGSREPGTVGAALSLGGLSAGLIADLVHVHPASVMLALRAKTGPGQVFLISDAMAPAGTQVSSFHLGGRRIVRREGRLELADGTLAGADLDLSQAVRNLVGLGVDRQEALSMATSVPAGVAGFTDGTGSLAPGGPADFVHLDEKLHLKSVWQRGKPVAKA